MVTTLFAAIGACTNASGCNLNGDCVAGQCVCDPGWTSASCGVLKLGPVNKARRPGLYNYSQVTWGASPIQDADGNWHIFHAQLSHSL